MKHLLYIHCKIYFKLPVLFAILFLFPLLTIAQADSTAAPIDSANQQTDIPETPELVSPTIDFKAIQKADNNLEFKVELRAKIKGTIYKLPKLKLNFINVNDSGNNNIGSVITDGFGKASLIIKADSFTPDAEGKLHFKVGYAGNKSLAAAEEEVSFKKAKLILTPVKEDSSLSVSVKLVDLSTGAETPVAAAELGLFVKRMINPMKVGEGTTDEAGEATIEFPLNLPGDAKGNLHIIAKVDDNEVFGNVEASFDEKWGVAVSDKKEEMPRALWSVHPPLWMLITFVVLMLAVWGHYLFIVVELFRLRKEQPKTTIQ
jgi:hypothetical protein